MGGRGKRYEEPKLNIKKVIAVIVAFIVVVMTVILISGILTKEEKTGKIVSLDYFASFKNNKWGIIDSEGNNVINPSYQEMIIVPNSKNDIFLCTYDVNYETGEYKTKVLNSKNETIFDGYEKIEAIQNKDENNNLWYENNILKIQKNGKYGIINFTGKTLLEPEYDSITALPGIKNALLIEKDKKYGISDNDGKIIIDVLYTEITNIGKDNKSGYIVKDENGKYGLMDYSKTQILGFKYDEIKKVYNNDLYVVVENGKQKLVKRLGDEVLVDGFDEITQILKTQNTGIIYKIGEKYGVKALDGNTILEPVYDELEEGKAGILIAKKDGKTGIIDMEGKEKIPYQYVSIIYNEKADFYIAEDENINNSIIDNNYEIKQTGILIKMDIEKGYFELRQNDEYKYYNFKFEEKEAKDILPSNTLFVSKKDGKYGFVDKDGIVIVNYIYDDVTEQNAYGYAGIKRDGKWGSINSKGEVIIEPTYDLENYLIVDFIGKWHLGQDINMNYYNQQ